MTLSRIYVSEDVDVRLRNLKARTGMAPNLLCRIAFCLSLSEPGTPDETLYTDGHAREFNRFTLTGQWDVFFFSLLRERIVQDGLDPEVELESQFKAHLSRGIGLLSQRLKSLVDLVALLPVATPSDDYELTGPNTFETPKQKKEHRLRHT